MWKKKGHLLKVNNYASIPYAHHLNGDLFRIFYSSRNDKGQSQPYYIDAIINNATISLVGETKGPILDLGGIGTFDDSGIMPSCVLKHEDKIYMYYIGWNPQVSVSYRLSIGLAISKDDGETFTKYSEGPILDRSIDEPYFNTAPFVVKEDIWRMWYVSCTGWVTHENKTEPVYNIKYCESNDGIHWVKNNVTCADYVDGIDAIGRPCIFKNNDIYELYFSHRRSADYRLNKSNSYKIGKTISKDGIEFSHYETNIMDFSPSPWDDNMQEYCHVFSHNDVIYMIYNGNSFGKNGILYAIK